MPFLTAFRRARAREFQPGGPVCARIGTRRLGQHEKIFNRAARSARKSRDVAVWFARRGFNENVWSAHEILNEAAQSAREDVNGAVWLARKMFNRAI